MPVLLLGCKWLKAAQVLNMPSGPVLALAAESDARKDLGIFVVPDGAQFHLSAPLATARRTEVVGTLQLVHNDRHSHRIYLTKYTVLQALVSLLGPPSHEADDEWRPLVLRRGPVDGLPLCVTCQRVVNQAGQCNACYELGRKIA